MKGIQLRLGLVLAGLFIVSAVGAVSTYLGIEANMASATVINLAGAQRMLSQKMTKEALLLARGGGGADLAASFQKSVATFDGVLKGLGDGDADLKLPPLTDGPARQQWEVVVGKWSAIYPQLAGAGPSGSTVSSAAALESTESTLLLESNKLVSLLEAESNAKLRRLQAVQGALVLFSFAALTIGWLVVRRSIIRPVIAASDRLNALAAGVLACHPLTYTGRDEIGAMTGALNGMAGQLRGLIGRTAELAQVVLKTADELSETTGTVAESAQEVSAAIASVAQGTSDQAAAVVSVNRITGDLSGGIE